MAYQPSWVINVKAIFCRKKKNQWYHLIPNLDFIPLPNVLVWKMNVLAQLEFEPAYYDVLI